MSKLGSWLHTHLGVPEVNLRPYASTIGGIAGGALFGPAGAALGAGLFKTGDNLAHHDSLGHALGQGVLNAGLAYGTSAGLGHFFGDATPEGAASGLPSPGGSLPPIGELPRPSMIPSAVPTASISTASKVADQGPGFFGSLKHVGSALLDKDHAATTLQAAGMGASAMGNYSAAKTQADAANRRLSLEEQEYNDTNTRDARLDPVRQLLIEQLQKRLGLLPSTVGAR